MAWEEARPGLELRAAAAASHDPPAMAAMIRELEEQKKAAVAEEDYDEAKRLKLRIEELRGGATA